MDNVTVEESSIVIVTVPGGPVEIRLAVKFTPEMFAFVIVCGELLVGLNVYPAKVGVRV
jgi:hypothetical protein